MHADEEESRREYGFCLGNLACDLEKSGISVQLLHPGFVATDMTAGFESSSKRSTKDSVCGLLDIIESGFARKTASGTFWHGNYGEGITAIAW